MTTTISPDKIDRKKAPAIYNIGELYLPADEVTILDNGIKLHTLSDGNAGVCRIKIVLPGGIVESAQPKLYDMANKMLLEGSRTYPSDKLSEILEYNGAWTGVDISTHHSSLSLFCTNDKYSSLLPLVVEMVTSPVYDHNILSNLLNREAARLRIEERKVAYQASYAMRRLVYGADNPLSAKPSPEELLSMSTDILSSAHHRRIDTKGIHVYLSGELSDKMITETAVKLSSIRSECDFALQKLLFPTHDKGSRVHVEMADSLQSCVKLMIPTIGRDNIDYVPLRMAVIALGGYFGSRLMLNIREEKGLTYGITASLLGFNNNGFISVSSQTDSTTVNTLIDETIKEIERMKDPASYNQDEINRISRFILSELSAVLDSPFSRSDFLCTEVTANTPVGYFAMQEKVARILSPEMLADLASKYFDTDNLFIATAGKS